MMNKNSSSCSFLSVIDKIDAKLYDDPTKTAITFKDSHVNYHQLITESNRLAHYLLSLGIGKGDIVSVCLERSPKLIISLLAILKTGAAYLPLDPEYPKDRIEFMVEDSGAKTFITQPRFENKFDILIPKLILEEIWSELEIYSHRSNHLSEAFSMLQE